MPKGGVDLVTTGNAKIMYYAKYAILLSYGVPVAIDTNEEVKYHGMFFPPGKYVTDRHWSQTTSCHIGRWRRKVGGDNAEIMPQALLSKLYHETRYGY